MTIKRQMKQRERDDAIRHALLDDVKEDFFTMLRATGNVTQSLAHAGIGGETHRQLLYTCDSYREDILAAKAVHRSRFNADVMNAVYDRAIVGKERERYDKDGNVIARETVYSDSLLLFLAKRAVGETTGTAPLSTSHGNGSDINESSTSIEEQLGNLSVEQLEQLESIAGSMASKD